MNKQIKFILTILTALLLALTAACTAGGKGNEVHTPESRAAYIIKLAVREGFTDAYLTEEVIFTNASGDELSELVFYLYPEAYSKGAKESAYFDSMLAHNKRFGGIDISAVKVDGEDVAFEKEDIFLSVPLPKKLSDGASVSVKLGARIMLPSGTLRMGGDEHLTRLTNFYPVLSVYENGAFVKHTYSRIGDPFFSNDATYDVTVSVPQSVAVATSGKLISDEIQGETHVVNSVLDTGRDFAVVLSDRYEKESIVKGGVTYNYYSEKADGRCEFLVSAAEIFTEFFGEFPYEEFSVCESPFYYGGMEYPGLAIVNKTLAGSDKEEAIVHELLHQWIGCAVGSDGVTEPWVDESLVTYLTAYYHRLKGDEAAYSEQMGLYKKQFDAFYMTTTMNSPEYVARINRNIYEFHTLYEYDAVVYKCGAQMYRSLNDIFGDKKFRSAIRNYYSTYAHRNASGEKLITSLEKSFGNKASKIIRTYLENGNARC